VVLASGLLFALVFLSLTIYDPLTRGDSNIEERHEITRARAPGGSGKADLGNANHGGESHGGGHESGGREAASPEKH